MTEKQRQDALKNLQERINAISKKFSDERCLKPSPVCKSKVGSAGRYSYKPRKVMPKHLAFVTKFKEFDFWE